MLISKRKLRLMICFISDYCLPVMALAVSTNSCAIMGSTYMAALLFLISIGSICLADYDESFAS